MSDYNNLVFTGNLGRDVEMRYTPSGQAVAYFVVASNRQYNNSAGEAVKETIWYRVSAWGKLAEVCNQHIAKGSKVLIEGRLTPDPKTGGPKIWSKKDGTHGASFEVNANSVTFLSPKSESAQPVKEDEDIGF